MYKGLAYSSLQVIKGVISFQGDSREGRGLGTRLIIGQCPQNLL